MFWRNRNCIFDRVMLILNCQKTTFDNGCRGDVLFDAKTDELARHYERDFGAKQLPGVSAGGPKRFMLADEDAWNLFSNYLTEEDA